MFLRHGDLSEEEIHTGTKVQSLYMLHGEKLGPEKFYLNHQKVTHSRDMSLEC
ncbi:MAG: hypothetical protein FWF19_05745 [Euryarchaeota archaeon]|nr:hypothetical protein [Euryarchaeota archaeon]